MLVNDKSLLSILTHSPGTTIGVALVLLHLVSVVFAPLLIPYGPTQLVGTPMLPPGHPDFLLGTDVLGRDYLSRLLMGGRTSITVAIPAEFRAAIRPASVVPS